MEKQKRSFLNLALIHPFLIAIYLVLSLWLANIDQIPAFTLIRPLIFSLVVATVSLLAGQILFQKTAKATVFASLFVLLFLAYGRIFDLVDMKTVAGFLVGRHRFLLPVWIGLFAVGTLSIWRTRSTLSGVNQALTLISTCLVALMLGQSLLFSANRSQARASIVTDSLPSDVLQIDNLEGQTSETRDGLRDVYYIVLDAYARQDILQERHNVDNGAFIQQLRDLGFVVLDCAQSNYAWTPLSMGSSLNMNYLEALPVNTASNEERINYWDYLPLFQHSQVQQAFKDLGYRIVTFHPVYSWMDIPNSDVYFDREKTSSFYDKQETVNFQYLFLRTTAVRLLLEAQEYSPEKFEKLPTPILRLINPKASLLSSRHFKQYDQNLYALEQLENLPSLPGPKFVYAHLFLTHQPYTFNVDGSMRWPPEETVEGYNIQIQYTNTRMIDILKSIIDNSPIPPVIIVQSDHSYFFDESRLNIINAYYLPDGGSQALYPAITPVNSFRLVLNTYFGANYPLLEDVSYFSLKNLPYSFETVPNTCLKNTK